MQIHKIECSIEHALKQNVNKLIFKKLGKEGKKHKWECVGNSSG